VPDCKKSIHHTPDINGFSWFNQDCFVAPAAWGFGDESRVDATLRGAGINNWDIAIYKTTNFGPDNRLGLQFRTEFFNAFNRVQFGPPNTGCCFDPATNTGNNKSFGVVNSQLNTPRLIQLALKFLF
jgi:hypothetical protein